MDIDSAIFKDLESFGKRKVFQSGYGNVLDFCLGEVLTTLEWILLSVILNTVYLVFVLVTICSTKSNPPTNKKRGIATYALLFLWGFKIQ